MDQRVGDLFPVDRSVDTACPIGGPEVPAVGVVQGPGRVEEEQVIVPPSSASQKSHTQESGRVNMISLSRRLEAMLLMKERWKAMNSASTGMVIREA